MALSEAAGDEQPLVGAEASGRWGLSAITPASRYYWLRLLLENPAVVASLCLPR